VTRESVEGVAGGLLTARLVTVTYSYALNG